MKQRKAVFLDRDGTINEEAGYPGDFSQVRIFPWSYEAVRKLNRADFLAVVVTNQSGIARGYFREEALLRMHEEMKGAFEKRGARLDGIFHCPHFRPSLLPEYNVDCACRKPKPGMAHDAAEKLNIDLASSYVVGDKTDDVLFGLNIQAKPVLVLTGSGRDTLEKLRELNIRPAFIAGNLLDAVDWIIREERLTAPGNG
jgi:D-glycero-D-manno-heptose 1,7-bisphosphate phosphatase